MSEIEAKCKAIELEINDGILPHFEITCPYCGSKLIYEERILDVCSGIYCGFCNQRIDKEKLIHE